MNSKVTGLSSNCSCFKMCDPGSRGGRNRCVWGGPDFQLQIKKLWDVTYSTVIIVNNNVFYSCKLLRDILKVLITRIKNL